jgi:hypothetical protein
MTSETPIEVLAEAAKRGLKVSFQSPFSLVVEPAERCPDDFADTLSQHKGRLLALLQLPFVMAYSRILEDTIFFCEDDRTRAALVQAGADESSIYTRAELKILVLRNRAQPFLPAELCQIHAARKTFKGRVGE